MDSCLITKYLEKVTEIKEDTQQLIRMIDEIVEFSKTTLSDNQAWAVKMAMKYPIAPIIESQVVMKKRQCEFPKDTEDCTTPCKKSR